MNKYTIGLDFNTKFTRAVSVKITNWEFYYKTVIRIPFLGQF